LKAEGKKKKKESKWPCNIKGKRQGRIVCVRISLVIFYSKKEKNKVSATKKQTEKKGRTINNFIRTSNQHIESREKSSTRT
jgi:hypothetical protein